jgi:hypothetical protein
VSENDDQDPNQFVVAIGLLGCALDNHSDPEDGARHAKNQKQESKDHGWLQSQNSPRIGCDKRKASYHPTSSDVNRRLHSLRIGRSFSG